MLITLILLALIALSGMALTYLVADDERMMWRLSAGSIAGSALFGLVVFVLASAASFSPAVIVISLIISLLPLLLLRRVDIRPRFEADYAHARAAFDGIDQRKMLQIAYYAFFFIVFWFFFERAVFELKDGIYTGGSNNYGDLPFHLGAIFGFTEQPVFPPMNPSWAGAKFSYPFMADLLAAAFVKLGLDYKAVIFVQNITWAFALLVIIERFAAKLTNNKLAGRIAPALLFFSGGLGFVWFFNDMMGWSKGVGDFLLNMPKDYTINDEFRWGNPMVVLFITQRGLLFGMPLTILVIQHLWNIFTRRDENEAAAAPAEAAETEPEPKSEKKKNKRAKAGLAGTAGTLPAVTLSFIPPTMRPYVPSFLVGLLAGTLPLVHLHSLAALFVISVFLLAMRPSRIGQWLAFGVGTALIAVPELLWSITGTATDTTKFFGWHFGWDHRNTAFVWFWIKNTGIVFPAIAAALFLLWTRRRRAAAEADILDTARPRSNAPDAVSLLLFYIPFAFLFVLTNVVKLAPWEWDNIKVLIYWFIGSLPLIAYALAWCWQMRKGWNYIAMACLVLLCLSGAIDVWRTATRQMNYRVFEPGAMAVADQMKQKTDPGAMFLNGPTFNPATVLAGRQSLMRYSGHLGSYGIDYGPREADVKQIYLGGAAADGLLQKHNIDYVLVSPFEKNDLKANEEYFKKFPVIAESGQFKVYKVK